MVKQPMLEFKKDILTEVGRRQDTEKIAKWCDQEILDSQKLYDELMRKFDDAEHNTNQKTLEDESIQELKLLESNLSKLAQSIHSIYV